MLDVVGVIIHHVENHTDASLVQRLYHLLELADAYLRFVRIGGIATLGHVVVHGVVTPIIFVVSEACLIYRTIVVTGQNVDGIHA